MPDHRRPTPSSAGDAGATTFDRVTLHAFMLAVTVAAAVFLAYGPAAALEHIAAAAVANAEAMPVPDEAAWQGTMVF